MGLLLVALLGTALAVAKPAIADPAIELFDANIRYTSGIFVPLPTYNASTVKPLTTETWLLKSRSVSRVAADGVSLLIVRAELPRNGGSRVNVALVSDHPEADPGSLWAINDQAVVDRSPSGGRIDEVSSDRRRLDIPTVVVGRKRYAFFVYRAPRNFDSLTDSTAHIASRTAQLVLRGGRLPDDPTLQETLTIVRPLVIFVHGTFANNDAWLHFPLWRDSANELQNFQPLPGALPFAADRISYNWIWNATGGVVENAETILAQLVASVLYWREATGAAATQADVVTHSFGGFIARQTAQTQPDPHPLAPNNQSNFRAAANWGHGPIHKLITLAATHRGSAGANASAFLNQFGNQHIFFFNTNVRGVACRSGSYIDRGALRDQMILSQALNALGETRVPGHVVVGSGRAKLDPSGFYLRQELAIVSADTATGPYANALNNAAEGCGSDALTNYVFNLDPNVPPLTNGNACSTVPNYDLTVSAYSSQGLLPTGATTTAVDLEHISGLPLIGYLNHTALHDPSTGSTEIVGAVSSRVRFLLQQPTGSSLFSHFPAVASVGPTPLEDTFSSQFDPVWLGHGTDCQPPQWVQPCRVTYTGIKVVPEKLVLEGSLPTPVYVYGQLDGQWFSRTPPLPSRVIRRPIDTAPWRSPVPIRRS